MSGFRVVGVVEVCGRGGSVGVVFGGSGFWERFGCKEGIILGWYVIWIWGGYVVYWGFWDSWACFGYR